MSVVKFKEELITALRKFRKCIRKDMEISHNVL